METTKKQTIWTPEMVKIFLMLAGCIGLVATLAAWLFEEGPLPTPWFMALFSALYILTVTVTARSRRGWAFGALQLACFNTVMYLAYIV
jgi:hypothetical protein